MGGRPRNLPDVVELLVTRAIGRNLTPIQGCIVQILAVVVDLCRMLGEPTPHEADPTGEHYAFEKRVTKGGGGDGFADVWKRGFFAWEYKGKKADLKAAYRQLLDYREDLENPPLLIVSDGLASFAMAGSSHPAAAG